MTQKEVPPGIRRLALQELNTDLRAAPRNTVGLTSESTCVGKLVRFEVSPDVSGRLQFALLTTPGINGALKVIPLDWIVPESKKPRPRVDWDICLF